MTSLCPTYHQYRSFDAIYLFKIKGPENLVVKVFDISQKQLFKGAFTLEQIGAPSLAEVRTKPTAFLEALSQKNLLPLKVMLPPDAEGSSIQTCEEALTGAIRTYKPQALIESEHMQEFTCPLSMQVFREPVMDNHGHTFEKEWIEKIRKTKNVCPISRQPIHSLTPNLSVAQALEKWQQKDPLPNLSHFSKENPQLAAKHLEVAEACVKAEEYEEALDSYTKAFKFTKSSEAYKALPELFIRMKEPKKAFLAFLYLAQYQLAEKKTLISHCNPRTSRQAC